ncbi:MAG: TatD family hydrolase [Rhodospirillaceae bacterium]
MLVDSHCHLDFPDFEGELDAVVARARDAGIGHMLTICTRVTEFARVRRVADGFDNMWCTVGIHPHNAESEPETTTADLVALAGDPKVVAFGETGLDFYYEHSPRERQERSFRAHIAASRQTGLPIVIHTRDADDDTIRIMRDEMAAGPFTGVVHCFSGGPELAAAAVDLGLYISISGIITFKTADALRETVRGVPLERLLVETDSPYLAPVPKRGKRNEPAFTAYTAEKLAELKAVSVAELTEATTANFFVLFSKTAPVESGAV